MPKAYHMKIGVACMTYMYNGLLGFWNTKTNENKVSNETFSLNSTVEQVKNDDSFGGFGELIFPVDINIPNNTTLEKVGDYYSWYNYINPNKTVEIVNYMKENEPPTFSVVGTNDGIANYRTMQTRINKIKANGTNAEIEVFEGLPHGFGLGEGTVAEGWIDKAIKFWENQIN